MNHTTAQDKTTQDKNAGCYEYESDEEEDVPVFSHKLADVNEHGFAACDEDGLVWKYDRHEDEWRKTESKCDGDCDVCEDKQKCDECGKVQEDDGLDLCNDCDKMMSMCSGDGHKCEYFAKDEMWRAGNCYYCSRECVEEYLNECLAEDRRPKPVHRPKIGDEDVVCESDKKCEDCDNFRTFLAIIHPADE